jgi:two-component system, cell cycle sensor histidine kinase and response regulator CckA
MIHADDRKDFAACNELAALENAPPTSSHEAPVIINQEAPDPLATILLVEDEASVRSVTREVLEAEGYRVVEAEDAIDGIRVCEQFRGKIDLVLTDVVMPGMNGREMARKLTERHAGLKIMFMSGYTDNPVLREAFSDYHTVYLQKPFTVQTLCGKVKDMLAGRMPAEYDDVM